MNTFTAPSEALRPTTVLATTSRAAMRWTWHAVRLPTLTLLLVLEPLVRVTLTTLAMLGLFTALFFEYVIRLPHFPFGLMLSISAGFGLLLLPYYLLIRGLSSQ